MGEENNGFRAKNWQAKIVVILISGPWVRENRIGPIFIFLLALTIMPIYIAIIHGPIRAI